VSSRRRTSVRPSQPASPAAFTSASPPPCRSGPFSPLSRRGSVSTTKATHRTMTMDNE
jgi:hypothetical protein